MYSISYVIIIDINVNMLSTSESDSFFQLFKCIIWAVWTHGYIIYTKKQDRIVHKYANWGTPSMWQCYCTLIWSKSLKPHWKSGIKLQIKPMLKHLKQQVKKNIQIFSVLDNMVIRFSCQFFHLTFNSYCCAFKFYYNSNVYLT